MSDFSLQEIVPGVNVAVFDQLWPTVMSWLPAASVPLLLLRSWLICSVLPETVSVLPLASTFTDCASAVEVRARVRTINRRFIVSGKRVLVRTYRVAAVSVKRAQSAQLVETQHLMVS